MQDLECGERRGDRGDREHQEDASLVAKRANATFCVVCDGMGAGTSGQIGGLGAPTSGTLALPQAAG